MKITVTALFVSAIMLFTSTGLLADVEVSYRPNGSTTVQQIGSNYNKFANSEKYNLPADTIIIQEASADVTGDGQADRVYLLGEQFPGSLIYMRHIYLLVEGSGAGKGMLVRFPQDRDGGYSPGMALRDFTGDGVDDVFVSAPTGGSGGLVNYNLYTFQKGTAKAVVPGDQLSKGAKFDVTLQPNFKATVRNLDLNKTFTLDVSPNKSEFVRTGVYSSSGSLLKETEGVVDPYSLLEPRDLDNDGVYELVGYQSIWAVYHANGIGNAESLWKWDGGRLRITQVAVYR